MSDLKKYTDYKTILAVTAYIWSKGKVLLLKRSANKRIDPNIYSGVGGKVEPGESIYDAIIREIEEETRIKEVHNLKPFSVSQFPDLRNKVEWIVVCFSCEIDDQVKVPVSDDGSFDWIDPRNIDSIPILIDIAQSLKIYVKDPSAFLLAFFPYDNEGNLLDGEIKSFSSKNP